MLAALRAVIEERKLPESPRKDLRRWYWCSVFLERYSSAVESKSRKDFAEIRNYWLDGKNEPSVFKDARERIGAAGYSVRDSASYASAIYSGVFCLLELRGARDWGRDEAIHLQHDKEHPLEDHHIFPRKYLNDHDITRRIEVNSIVNRTLISDQTNGKIRAKAPADYIASKEIFPTANIKSVLSAHFIDGEAFEMMQQATQNLSNESVMNIYNGFLDARERAIVSEIRRVCGL